MFSRGREFLGVSCCLGMFEREVGNSGWLPLASFPPNGIKVEIWRDRTLCAPSCSSFSISTNGNKCYVWAMGCTAIRIAGKRLLIPRDMIKFCLITSNSKSRCSTWVTWSSQSWLSVCHTFVLARLGRSAVTRGAGLVAIGLLHSLPGTDAFFLSDLWARQRF